MSKVVITLEYKDPTKPSRSSKPMHADEAVITMREAVFRVAVGEYAVVYVTRENPLKTDLESAHLRDCSDDRM